MSDTKTKVHLTYDTAVELLKLAVMAKGADYKFAVAEPENANSYYYFEPETGAPGCIVGHVLAYQGLTMADLGDANTATGFQSLVRAHSVVTCDTYAKVLLENAQEEQDGGATWGRAVDRSIEYVERKKLEDAGE